MDLQGILGAIHSSTHLLNAGKNKKMHVRIVRWLEKLNPIPVWQNHILAINTSHSKSQTTFNMMVN